MYTHWSLASRNLSGLSLLSRVTSQSPKCSCGHARPRRAGLWSCDWSGAATKEHVPACRMVSAHNREPQQEGASISSDKETNKPVKTTARGWPFLPSFSWGEGSRPSCVLLTSSSPLMIRCTWWLVTLGRKGVKSTFQMFLASMLLLVPKISHVIEIGICRLYILWSFFVCLFQSRLWKVAFVSWCGNRQAHSFSQPLQFTTLVCHNPTLYQLLPHRGTQLMGD